MTTRLEIPVERIVFAIQDLLNTVAAKSATQLESRVENWQIKLYRLRRTIRIDIKENPAIREPSKTVDT